MTQRHRRADDATMLSMIVLPSPAPLALWTAVGSCPSILDIPEASEYETVGLDSPADLAAHTRVLTRRSPSRHRLPHATNVRIERGMAVLSDQMTVRRVGLGLAVGMPTALSALVAFTPGHSGAVDVTATAQQGASTVHQGSTVSRDQVRLPLVATATAEPTVAPTQAPAPPTVPPTAAAVASAAGAAAATVASSDAGWIRPCDGPVTSEYGPRWGTVHPGIDLGCPYGAPILAATTGTVTFAGWQSGYGNFVMIEDTDGTVSAYGHMSAITARAGQAVTPGTQLGRVGATGDATGPHLHFEIRIGGRVSNPRPFMAARGIDFGPRV
ncbi:MAG: peptidase [Mycobacterium sp.]|nr:peptidase [Mycobacterium sp.]